MVSRPEEGREPLVDQSISAAAGTESQGHMELSDEELVIQAWEVATRRGWAFVIHTLLRTEMQSFPPAVHEEGEQDSLGKLGGYSPKSPEKVEDLEGSVDKSSACTPPVHSDNPMVSQESDDEETAEVDLPGLEKSELLAAEDSSSSCEDPAMESQGGLHADEPVMHPKIQEFIDEVTMVFNKCFFGGEESTGARAPLNADASADNSTPGSSEGARVLSGNSHASVPGVPQMPPPWHSPPPQQAALVPAVPAVSSKVLPPPGYFLSPPLAAHVSKPLREMVVALQYFDMFVLLPKDSVDILVSGPERRTLDRWQRGFIIMGSILLEDAPEKLVGFFNYFDTIRKAYDQAAWGGWLIYDERFRRMKQGSPGLSWAFINTELWLQMVNPQRVFTMPPPPPVNHFRVLPGKIGMCWRYDKNECLRGSLCRYTHKCSKCEGDHPGIMCTAVQAASDEPEAKKPK
ncbi:uncharacterized protein [Pleurodeles waltl]